MQNLLIEFLFPHIVDILEYLKSLMIVILFLLNKTCKCGLAIFQDFILRWLTYFRTKWWNDKDVLSHHWTVSTFVLFNSWKPHTYHFESS